MEQLTLKDIYMVAASLIKQGEDISKYPVYIGDDDELNGIHCGWYTNIIDVNDDDENNQYLLEMINENRSNNELKSKAFLIS